MGKCLASRQKTDVTTMGPHCGQGGVSPREGTLPGRRRLTPRGARSSADRGRRVRGVDRAPDLVGVPRVAGREVQAREGHRWGGAGAPAPGGAEAPAPGGAEAPAYGDAGAPAPGGAEAPAPGGAEAPAYGDAGAPAPDEHRSRDYPRQAQPRLV